jgi:hypothetical protein
MASITGATLKDQIERAISAHGVFKFKLSHMVEAATSEMTPITVAADDQCPVGEWLRYALDDSVRGTAHYAKVRELHATFHQAAGEVASLAAARRRTEALEAMELTSTFKRASDQLIAALEAWADELAPEAPQPSRAVAPSQTGEGVAAEGEERAQAAGGEVAAAEGEEELPYGWWFDSPAKLEEEAHEISDHEERRRPEATEGAQPEAAETPQADEVTSIQDWFGLPKSTSPHEPAAEKKTSGPAEGDEGNTPEEDVQDE